jgi:putative solute:sodium symporter small subunit
MFEVQAHSPALRQRKRRLTFVLLCVWLSVSFGPAFFARTLSFEVAGWPVHFWMAAQGSILVFIIIVVVYAWLMNRWESQEAAKGIEESL